MTDPISNLAVNITQHASRQTYYTIRLLADRNRAADAYRAYAYFRWVDDVLDAEPGAGKGQHLPDSASVTTWVPKPAAANQARRVFLQRQQALLEKAYCGDSLCNLCPEEEMLSELVRNDTEQNSGLQCYLRNMMAVMAFDVARRSRLISQAELHTYTHSLAVAVTEALHYFIGHDDASPHNQARYLAVSAAHITHLLRDTVEDTQAGYFNIPCEMLNHYATMPDLHSEAYRAWVRHRVALARTYFKQGKAYLHQVENARCRLAGFAYIARFEWLLNTIEKEDYCLRAQYNDRKSILSGVEISFLAASSALQAQPASRLEGKTQ